MSLHPAFAAYLDELNPLVEAAQAAGVEASPQSARAALASLNQFALEPETIAQVTNTQIAGVPVRVYVPNPREAADVVFFVHGGGHMAGDLDVYDFSARRLAAATQMVVVSVDYARSPEAPYPAGLQQTYAVLDALPAALTDTKVTGRIHGFADSGGAAKLASIAQRTAAGSWHSPIDRQVLLYPSLDYTMSGESMQTYATDYFLSKERVGWYFDNYFPAGADRRAASPLFGPYSSEMPSTLVIAAEYDPLLSEAEAYVSRGIRNGADMHLLVASGMIHAFAFFEDKVPQDIERLYQVSAEFLKTGHAPDTWAPLV